MARILIASQPIAGHLFPLLPIAEELVRRGHEVRWYTGRKYAARVRATGARFEPFTLARDYDDADFGAAFPGRDAFSGLRQVQFDVRHIFVGGIEDSLRDLQALAREWPWDVTLADQTLNAALVLEELGGPPCALLGVLPLGIHSRDAAPFGLGLAPRGGLVGRARNRALRWVTQTAVFGDSSREVGALYRGLGLPPRPFEPPTAPSLMLQATARAFEYPLSDHPPQLHFIGPLIPPTPPGLILPGWWADVVGADRPVVVITQGTLATDPRDLILPALRGLAGEELLVVAAGVRDPALLGALPANARTAPFVPFPALLPHARVYVSNGGYGGVQQALMLDLPVVVAGTTEDKAEVARRVEVAGVGLRLGTRTPRPEQVRAAVLRLLSDPAPRLNAARLGAALRAHDAPREAAELLEVLLRTGRPVLARPGGTG